MCGVAALKPWLPASRRDMMELVSLGVGAPVFVGRMAELATLDAAFERVRRGRPSAVLIGGEAGVGKSRLLSEFAARARATGVSRVLYGYCLELSAEGLPFAPFTTVLRELVRGLGTEGVAALLPGRGGQELARLLPELGEPDIHGDPGEARARMFEQALTLFARLAEGGPVLLVIEDAHWSDPSTRDLLAFLVGNQRVLDNVLIVVTFRSDELHRGHPLRPVLAELDRLGWVVRLDLPRLTRREGRELAAALLGREPEPELADRVFSRSEGNPLFIEALLSRDDLLGPGLPESLRDLVLADVRRLPAETQEVLGALGVAGQRSGHALLAAVTGLGDKPLVAALKPAVSANVLVPDADGYAFRHALIREAILGEVLPGEKTRLHTRLAEILAADPSLVAPGRAEIEQAHHWYLAHDAARALESTWSAAAVAGRSLAHAERLALLARILELWPALPDAAERLGASHLDVLESAAEAAPAAGEDEKGIGFATTALKEIDPGREPARAAVLLEQRGLMKYRLGRADSIDELREALRLMPASPPSAVRARMLARCAKRMATSHEPGASAMAEEALTLARQTGDAATEAYALITVAEAHAHAPGYQLTSRSLEMLAQARALAERAQAYDPQLQATITESDLLEGMGEHERAAQVARQGVISAREYGLARATGTLLAANVAEPLMSLGRWDEAGDVIEHALELSPPPGTRAVLLLLAGQMALARGDLAGAAQSAAATRNALTRFGYRDQTHLPLAQLETGLRLAQDRPGDALTITGQALERAEVQRSPRYTWPLLVAGAQACGMALTSAAAARDDSLATRAHRLLDRLRRLAETLDVIGPVQQAHRLTFAADSARAGVAEGAPGADTLAGWDAAAQAWDRVHCAYPQACALLRAAEAAMDGGDRDGAAQRLARAAPLADGLAAVPLREQIGSLARRARLSLPVRPAGGPAEENFGLTAREIEVLRLVSAGRANRDIAAELFISAKTASVHVSNILAKLHAASRTEAAAIAHRIGLADDGPRAAGLEKS
jgi:DNA-binding CsgD family transcriptional regulator/tetratricopeptide (TPR) repeat protein